MEQEVNKKGTDTGKNETKAAKKKANIETEKLEKWWQKMETEEGALEIRTKADEKIGSCPVCKGKH